MCVCMRKVKEKNEGEWFLTFFFVCKKRTLLWGKGSATKLFWCLVFK